MDYLAPNYNKSAWLTAREAAELAGVSIRTIYRWRKMGIVKCEYLDTDSIARPFYHEDSVREAAGFLKDECA